MVCADLGLAGGAPRRMEQCPYANVAQRTLFIIRFHARPLRRIDTVTTSTNHLGNYLGNLFRQSSPHLFSGDPATHDDDMVFYGIIDGEIK